jgi:hypothetical protein
VTAAEYANAIPTATATSTIMSSVRARIAAHAPVKKIEDEYRTTGRLSNKSHQFRPIPKGVASSEPISPEPTPDHNTIGTVNATETTKRLRMSATIAAIDMPA